MKHSYTLDIECEWMVFRRGGTSICVQSLILFFDALTPGLGYEPCGLECVHSVCSAVSGLLQEIPSGYNGPWFKPICVFFGGDQHEER